jgi:hypothetical protein
MNALEAFSDPRHARRGCSATKCSSKPCSSQMCVDRARSVVGARGSLNLAGDDGRDNTTDRFTRRAWGNRGCAPAEVSRLIHRERRVSSIGLALQQEGRVRHVTEAMVATAGKREGRTAATSIGCKMLGRGTGPAIPIRQADQANRRASTCRVMTMPATGNSDAPSAKAPCKLSVWSRAFRAYLPGYDVTLLGAQHVSSSPFRRSRLNRSHNAIR